MNTLILIGVLLITIGLAAGLAYLAGLAKGRKEGAATIAQLTVERNSAVAVRDSLARQLKAAINSSKSVDEIESRLKGGTA